MADIKTNLRELSVALSIGLLIKKQEEISQDELFHGDRFFYLASKIIDSDISSAEEISNLKELPYDFVEIVKNGIRLGTAIYNNQNFEFNNNDTIKWVGNDTQKGDPVDIIIGKYKFSLKEDSFILKNMGLYELVNVLTGANFTKGKLHVFNDFSKKEYDEWFSFSWNYLIHALKTRNSPIYVNNSLSKIHINAENNVVFQYLDKISEIPANINTNEEFMKYTCSVTREKVFSKWINENLSYNNDYLSLKKRCAEEAGQKICLYITQNYNEGNLFKFLQIYPFEYYYAKTTSKDLSVYRIPPIGEFNNHISFEDCHYEVPESQLNIITTLKNLQTNCKLTFRNECRFSHGQFNGSPEAKMYIRKKTPMSEIYEPII